MNSKELLAYLRNYGYQGGLNLSLICEFLDQINMALEVQQDKYFVVPVVEREEEKL